jgi:hypothetical protein
MEEKKYKYSAVFNIEPSAEDVVTLFPRTWRPYKFALADDPLGPPDFDFIEEVTKSIRSAILATVRDWRGYKSEYRSEGANFYQNKDTHSWQKMMLGKPWILTWEREEDLEEGFKEIVIPKQAAISDLEE